MSELRFCLRCGRRLDDPPADPDGFCSLCRATTTPAERAAFLPLAGVMAVLGRLAADLNDVVDQLGGLTLADFRERRR